MAVNNRGLISTATITRPANVTVYAANDVIATATSASLFEGVAIENEGGGVINNAVIISSANQATKLSCDLLLFSADQTIAADNAAYVPTDIDLNKLIGVISFATASWVGGDATVGVGGNAYCVAQNVGIAVTQGTIYGVLVARNAYTPISGEIFTVKLMSRY